MEARLTRWLLDSNVLIDALAGLPHGRRVLREARNRPNVELAFSSITRIEVLGFPNLGAGGGRAPKFAGRICGGYHFKCGRRANDSHTQVDSDKNPGRSHCGERTSHASHFGHAKYR
jgi:hypothetical protein